MENKQLMRLIQEQCDPEEVIDLLNMGVGELCLKLRRDIILHRERFEDYLEINLEEDEEV